MVARLARAWRSTAALRGAIRTPADVAFALRIGAFVVRAPADLGRVDVASYLTNLRRASRPAARDRAASQERIVRLRAGILALPMLWRRSSCYTRALVLFRFLDADGGDVRLHLGIEERVAGERLHGHAWVSVDGVVIEGPEGVILERLREIPVLARR